MLSDVLTRDEGFRRRGFIDEARVGGKRRRAQGRHMHVRFVV